MALEYANLEGQKVAPAVSPLLPKTLKQPGGPLDVRIVRKRSSLPTFRYIVHVANRATATPRQLVDAIVAIEGFPGRVVFISDLHPVDVEPVLDLVQQTRDALAPEWGGRVSDVSFVAQRGDDLTFPYRRKLSGARIRMTPQSYEAFKQSARPLH